VALAALLPTLGWGGEGLVSSGSEWLWPRLQARITLQTATLAPVTLSRPADGSSGAPRGVQGGALLGDYVFASPGFGDFRATSGVMLGTPNGAPTLALSPLSRLSVSVLDASLAGGAIGAAGQAGASEGLTTLPYLGLGYSSASLWRGLSLSADLGVVAGRPAGLNGLGRAMLGSQGLEAGARDLRLAPVLQLGARYSF